MIDTVPLDRSITDAELWNGDIITFEKVDLNIIGFYYADWPRAASCNSRRRTSVSRNCRDTNVQFRAEI